LPAAPVMRMCVVRAGRVASPSCMCALGQLPLWFWVNKKGNRRICKAGAYRKGQLPLWFWIKKKKNRRICIRCLSISTETWMRSFITRSFIGVKKLQEKNRIVLFLHLNKNNRQKTLKPFCFSRFFFFHVFWEFSRRGELENTTHKNRNVYLPWFFFASDPPTTKVFFVCI
jgi:hypothetical protein